MYERKPQNSVKQLSFNLKIFKNNKNNDIYHLVDLARNMWQKKKKKRFVAGEAHMGLWEY